MKMVPNMKHTRVAVLLTVVLPVAAAIAGEFDCMIEPRKSVEIRAASEGLIERIWVDRGDMVKVGQVLVTLDSGVEKAALDAARYRTTMQGKISTGESRVEFASQKYARRAQLASQSFISTQDRDEALAEKRLPIGAYGKLALGRSVEVVPESPVTGRYQAKVKVIDRVMDPASGTFGVRLELPNAGLKQPAGIKCRLNLPGVAGRTVLAPAGANRATPAGVAQ